MSRVGLLVAVLSAATLGAGCQRLRPEKVLVAGGVVPHAGTPAGQIELVRKSYSTSQQSPYDNAAALALLDSGLALSRTFCNEFLDRLGESVQRTEGFMKGTALAGTTTAAVLGAASAGSSSIALTAMGFTTILAGGEIYQTVYLFTPEIGSLRVIVNKAIDAVVEAADDKRVRPDHTFNSVVLAIQSATHVCQVDGLRKLVNEAVKAGTVSATFEHYGDNLVSIVDEQVQQQVADALGVESINQTQLAAFYWLYRGGPTVEERKTIYATLKGLTSPLPVTEKGETDASFKHESKIRGALSQLSNKGRAALDTIIADTKAKMSKPAEDNGGEDAGEDSERAPARAASARSRAPIRMVPSGAPPMGYIGVEVH